MPVLTPASSATIRIVVPAKPSRAITAAAPRQICSRRMGPMPSLGIASLYPLQDVVELRRDRRMSGDRFARTENVLSFKVLPGAARPLSTGAPRMPRRAIAFGTQRRGQRLIAALAQTLEQAGLHRR